MGIVAVGLLAIPVLIGGVALVATELRGRALPAGGRVSDLPRFRTVLIGCLLVAVGMEAAGVAPVHALVGAAVANGVAAPGVLGMLVVAGRSGALLGAERTGRVATGVLGIGVVLATCAPLLWIISALMNT